MFVRSQSQIALDNPAAKGYRLTRLQAETAFGHDLIERVLEDGVASLVSTYHEPARTLRSRREQLGLTLEQLADTAHLSIETVVNSETPGKIIPIQELNELCQVLALDETVLGYAPTAGGDYDLGVRLRMLAESRDGKSFSASTIAKLVEAAWVVAKQSTLAETLGRNIHHLASSAHRKDRDYSYPTFEKGYLLAEKTRSLLGLDEESPIESVRSLIEEDLNIPLIQTKLDTRFAGATIANGAYRGVVVNERGRNADVAVRRMTMCHELAHLLWDPDEKLDRLLVDDYESIEGRPSVSDPVEMRANSFAVSFLAPRKGVEKIVESCTSTQSAIEIVSEKYGISISAARYHIKNICRLETQSIPARNIDFTSWIPAENRTLDYAPGLSDETPISRRGMFSSIVAKAFIEEKISADTAMMCLKLKEKITTDSARKIAELWNT